MSDLQCDWTGFFEEQCDWTGFFEEELRFVRVGVTQVASEMETYRQEWVFRGG